MTGDNRQSESITDVASVAALGPVFPQQINLPLI